jgi:hypothetical protein
MRSIVILSVAACSACASDPYPELYAPVPGAYFLYASPVGQTPKLDTSVEATVKAARYCASLHRKIELVVTSEPDTATKTGRNVALFKCSPPPKALKE